MDIYNLDPSKSRVYNGIEYRIVSYLENNLLLCVIKEDAEKGVFPISTVIIPAT